MNTTSSLLQGLPFPFPCLRDAAGFVGMLPFFDASPMLFHPIGTKACLIKHAPDTPLWVYLAPDATDEVLLEALSVSDALQNADTLVSCIAQPRFLRLLQLSCPERIRSVTTIRSMYCPKPVFHSVEGAPVSAASVPFHTLLSLFDAIMPPEADRKARVAAASDFAKNEYAFAWSVDDTVVSLGQLASTVCGFSLLNDLVTAPEARNRGYMKALLSHLIGCVPPDSLPVLYVEEDNAAAKRVYRSVGFWDGLLLKSASFL